MAAKAKHPERFKVRRPCEKCPFRTAHEAWTELGESQRAFGHELLDATPGRWLVSLVEWLRRKLERDG